MSSLPLRLVSLLASCLLVAGCETDSLGSARQNRIQEKSTAFATLTPREQKEVTHGNVEVGFSDDMIYMALGKPDRIVTSADGQKIMWVFKNFYAPPALSKLTFQYANTQRKPHMTSANTPYQGGGNGQGAPQSFGGTGGVPLSQSMEMPDMISDTLYVFLRDHKVVEMQLESQNPTDEILTKDVTTEQHNSEQRTAK